MGSVTFAIRQKNNDQTSTDNTLAADDELQFDMNANMNYSVELVIGIATSGLLPSYSWAVDGPAAPNLVLIGGSTLILGDATLGGFTSTAYNDAQTVSDLTSNLWIKINCIVQNGGNDGTFVFKFAKSAGTSVTTLAGSYLRYTTVTE